MSLILKLPKIIESGRYTWENTKDSEEFVIEEYFSYDISSGNNNDFVERNDPQEHTDYTIHNDSQEHTDYSKHNDSQKHIDYTKCNVHQNHIDYTNHKNSRDFDNTKGTINLSNNPCADEKKINKLIHGNNISVCRYLVDNGYKSAIKLIYVDPPFFSKNDYKTQIKLKNKENQSIPVIRQKAYKDSWEDGMEEYLIMLASRLFAFKELLSEDGTIWVHLDWHASHYVKILMDEIFGEDNFINEIIWNYKSGGVSKRRFARKHDTLLFYGKGSDYYFKPLKEKSYNRGYKPYRFKGVEEFEDEKGWYTMVNMKDVWQIDMVGRTSAERTGYATQKPEALLKRIIESCTEKGDLCADFFGGSGTLSAVANKMNRTWLSCDMGGISTTSTLKRILGEHGAFRLYKAIDEKNIDEPISVEVEITEPVISDAKKKQISVKLTNYQLLNTDSIAVPQKELPVVKKIAKDDWIQLIDYFAVDFDYNGEVFRPQKILIRDNENINPIISMTYMGTDGSNNTPVKIAIKIGDIFGNSCIVIK